MSNPVFPGNIKAFGPDQIEGEYILPAHINELRAEVNAIETALGANLANTISSAPYNAKGALLTASAPGVLATLAPGTDGTVLTSSTAAASGLAWVAQQNPGTPRVVSIATTNAPSPNAATTDMYAITALASDVAFAAPSGTPADGQKLLVRIRDNGSSRVLAFNAIYKGIGQSLPTNTAAGKTLYLGFIYNAATAAWECLAQAQEV